MGKAVKKLQQLCQYIFYIYKFGLMILCLVEMQFQNWDDKFSKEITMILPMYFLCKVGLMYLCLVDM